MKMKLLYTLFISILSIVSLKAQSIDIKGTVLKTDTIKKQILDKGDLRIYYTLDYLKDSTNIHRKKHAETFLQVGQKTTRFMDYNKFRMDSVNDVSVKKGLSFATFLPAIMNLMNKVKYKPNIIEGYPDGQITFQEGIAMAKTHEYNEPIPQLKWKLLNRDTIIQNHVCKKASLNYRGRDYIAWYSEKIELPLGPYIFRGLPGLIFKIRDTKNNYIFNISGIEKMDEKEYIYRYSGNEIAHVSRDKFRKIDRNCHLDPLKDMMTCGKTIKMSKKTKATISPIPYNPIELK